MQQKLEKWRSQKHIKWTQSQTLEILVLNPPNIGIAMTIRYIYTCMGVCINSGIRYNCTRYIGIAYTRKLVPTPQHIFIRNYMKPQMNNDIAWKEKWDENNSED